jgi:hypothetical protein
MGLKHGKYVYVKRPDGFYVKVRVLNIRFGKKTEQGDISNPSRYIVTGYKTKTPPLTGVVVSEEALPEETKKIVESI